MEKIASKLLDSIQDFASENPGLTAGVLAGGGLGLLGGAMTPSESDDPNEDPDERIKRRVRNALVAGSLGAAGAGLMGYGANNMLLPIAEGSGLSLNESMDLQAPLLAAGAAGIPTWLWERNNKIKGAESLLKAMGGSNITGSNALSHLQSRISRDRYYLIDDLKKAFPGERTADILKKLEAAGVSTTNAYNKLGAKDLWSLLKYKLTPASRRPALPPGGSIKGQLARLSRAAMRNKATIGATAGAGLLANYLFGND